MPEPNQLERRFEARRQPLRAIAYRMLGSSSEADDAVQEAWVRLTRVDVDQIENLDAWLTTVVSRACLDLLRARRARPEVPLPSSPTHEPRDLVPDRDPEREAVLIDEVGRALLVVLDRLTPNERVAFVMHDLFAVPFEEIAPVVERSTAATKKLASRARGRVRGDSRVDQAELDRHRPLIDAFLAAARRGDVDAIVAMLAPDVVRRADLASLSPGRPPELRGRGAVGEEVRSFGQSSRFAALAVIDGDVGIVVAPAGRLERALRFSIADGQIVGYELVGDAVRLQQLELAVLDPPPLVPR